MEGVKELIELQRLNTELQSKKRRLAEIEALMNDDQELRQARAVLERTHTQFRKLETDQKSVEWDVDQTRDRIVQVERRLMGNQVTNPRELETLQREIDNLRKRQNDLEETTLDAMEKVERARPIVDARESAAAKLEGEWSAAQAAMGTERQEISAALPSLEEARAEAEAAVPSALRQTYQRIAAKKGGTGLAKLRGSSCSECRVELPQAHAQRVRGGQDLVACNSCGRLLYT